MRKLFDSKSGATFLAEMPGITIAVKKDCIELIYKLKPGLCIIINLVRIAKDEVVLFSNWGTYFKRLQNPQVQLPQIERTCPKLYRILTGEDEVKEMDLGTTPSTAAHGFGLRCKITPHQPLFTCIDQMLLDRFTDFAHTNLDIYNELVSNPPFPAWKTGLKELWN